MSETELHKIIEDLHSKTNKNQIIDEPPKVSYHDLKEKLLEFLINVKNLKFKDLIEQHFCIPIDRISRFLNMIEIELDLKYEKDS